LAVVRGTVTPDTGTWRIGLAWDKERLIQKRAHGAEASAKEAVARYPRPERLDGATLLEVSLVTGKRTRSGCRRVCADSPLVGERLYTFGAPAPRLGRSGLARQALHASALSFIHPSTGTRVTVTASMPEDIRALVARLRLASPQKTR